MFRYLLFILILSRFCVNSLKPKLIDYSTKLSQNEKSKLRLYCSIKEGTKPFRIEWFFDDDSVKQLSNIQIQNNDDFSVLTIDSLESTNSGNYSCKATNRYGEDAQFTVLTVQG